MPLLHVCVCASAQRVLWVGVHVTPCNPLNCLNREIGLLPQFMWNLCHTNVCVIPVYASRECIVWMYVCIFEFHFQLHFTEIKISSKFIMRCSHNARDIHRESDPFSRLQRNKRKVILQKEFVIIHWGFWRGFQIKKIVCLIIRKFIK